MTLCGSISAVLYANWSLTDSEAKDNIAFPTKDWFDYENASIPQITVTCLDEVAGKYLSSGTMLQMHSYPKFLVNCWIPIPRGSPGTAESQLAEDMRFEVSRIIMVNRNSIAQFSPIVPVDNGVPHNELDREPRILRYEITLIGAHDKILG